TELMMAGVNRFARVHLLPTEPLYPATPNRGLDRHVVDLIKIDDHATSEIWLLPKRHVRKTESAIVHGALNSRQFLLSPSNLTTSSRNSLTSSLSGARFRAR